MFSVCRTIVFAASEFLNPAQLFFLVLFLFDLHTKSKSINKVQKIQAIG